MRNPRTRGARSLFASVRRHASSYKLLPTGLLLFLGAAAVWWGCDSDTPLTPSGEQPSIRYAAEPGLRLGPIEGITTGWHMAPREFAVPRGTTVQLHCPIPSSAEIRWIGATEIVRDDAGSTAECPTTMVGSHDVHAEVTFAPDPKDGDPRKPRATAALRSAVYQCTFGVVDIDPMWIRVSNPRISRQPLYVSEGASNWELLHHYRSGSISAVHEIGRGRYATAVQTEVQVTADVTPPIFASLAEWRVDGEPVLLGESGSYAFARPGRHTVEVGPTGTSSNIIVDAYQVTIESDLTALDQIQDGVAISFTARTEPAGFEGLVTWLAATQFGTVDPVTAHGATFTVTFDETVGREEPGNLDRWVGIRADNATFNQDGPSTGSIEVAVKDANDSPYPDVLVRVEGVGLEAMTDGLGIATINSVPIGSLAITLVETVTVNNPGGDPIVIDIDADHLINVPVTGGLTSHVDCLFIVNAPQDKPGCGTVPTTSLAMATRDDGTFAATLESNVVDGQCPCNATMGGPFVPQLPGCPRKVEMLLAAKPPAALWTVTCSTCLGGVGCPTPVAASIILTFE